MVILNILRQGIVNVLVKIFQLRFINSFARPDSRDVEDLIKVLRKIMMKVFKISCRKFRIDQMKKNV